MRDAAGAAAQLRAMLPAGDAAAAADALAARLAALHTRGAQLVAALGDDGGAALGVMAAMQRVADDAAARWGVACRCNVRTAGLSHDRALAAHLRGIAREAVDQAVCGRGARELTITVTASPREGVLTVTDTVPPESPPPAADADARAALATRLMRLHADLIHGSLESGRDARGTHTLTCRFPNAG